MNNQVWKFFIFLTVTLLATSCATLHRHPGSGYTALRRPQPLLSSTDRHPQSMEEKIDFLEKKLTRKKERERYYQLSPHFRSPKERLSYLQLTSEIERVRWLAENEFEERMTKLTEIEQQAVEESEIFIGQRKLGVLQSWGRPKKVLFAGDRIFQNEKWLYESYQPSFEGYKKEVREVFFEQGLVAGWKRYWDK